MGAVARGIANAQRSRRPYVRRMGRTVGFALFTGCWLLVVRCVALFGPDGSWVGLARMSRSLSLRL
jgi:hypothetical protein